MTCTVDLPVPATALAIGAHPDDVELGCGATLAKWADAGCRVVLCICTDGAKGTWDPGADVEALVVRREAEQRDAAKVLGAADVEMLGFVDGELRDDAVTRAALCRVIRTVRPDVVLAHDPWTQYRLHPDHRGAGLATIAAIVAARDHHFFPELALAPHRPATLLCFEPGKVNHVEAVDGFVQRRVDALLAHRSQWRSTLGIADDAGDDRSRFVERQHAEARAQGVRAGVRAAEAFARVDDL
jgi:LmbE family N-acetylglucosaminyl deacetylase